MAPATPVLLALAGLAGLAAARLAGVRVAVDPIDGAGEPPGWRRGLQDATFGAAVGVLCMFATLAVPAAFGAIRFVRTEVAPGAAVAAAVVWGSALSLVVAGQEVVFRGWLFSRLARRLGIVGAAFLSSLLFAAIHLAAFRRFPAGLAAMFVFGLVACAATRASRALWWPIGFHGAWNLVLAFAAGVGIAPGAAIALRTIPRGEVWLSGGAAGPEASVSTVGTLIVCLGAVGLWASRRSRRHARGDR